MTPIKYIKGDATQPIGYGSRIIAHIVNSKGAFGAGFVVPLARRYPSVETSYRQWAASECLPTANQFALGNVQFVDVGDDITVANMLAQQGIGRRHGQIPLRYVALQECLVKVRERARATNATVHGPRFGAGLAGGDWALIADTIKRELSDHGIQVLIYDL
jgi:O-acetyl-ADP-ribose deacetylase (regulator of RNase III)